MRKSCEKKNFNILQKNIVQDKINVLLFCLFFLSVQVIWSKVSFYFFTIKPFMIIVFAENKDLTK